MLFSGVNKGVITPAVNQATAIFPNIVESDFRCPIEKFSTPILFH